MSSLYRHLPAVDKILDALTLDTASDVAALPRPLLRDLVNVFIDSCRDDIRNERIGSPDDLHLDALLPRLKTFIAVQARPHFRRVLNGTGVVVHTNLGRSLLADSAAKAVHDACVSYSNLEFDLSTGGRGSRYSHVEELLCKITGAEAALVVNNNAAAVMIILDTLCKGKEAIVSRGQLVEIGGSFRIPDVMEKSGATLREVGATNRTHVRDYKNAITEETAALMRVHTSNFRMVGFTKEVTLPEMKELADKHNLPVIEDLGSGSLFDFTEVGLPHEPTVQQVVEQGADVISFSGDKVLGGPQAGIIVGTKKYIDAIKSNPMNRALRIDKMTLAALEATFRLYLDPAQAKREVPTLRRIIATPEYLQTKAEQLGAVLEKALGEIFSVEIVSGSSRVGGGAFPEQDLPTSLVSLTYKSGASLVELKQRLLGVELPLVGMLEQDSFRLDPRTLSVEEFELVAKSLAEACVAVA
ncbi:MAG: L-seryl-tRNA(Sec) selenium transferase [Desulfovibrio sp.]